MAYEIDWTELANQDLEGVVRYLAEDNIDAARELGLKIISTIEDTAAFPFSGRKVPEKNNPLIREKIVRSHYRVIYRLNEEEGTLSVARVWRTSQGEPEL